MQLTAANIDTILVVTSCKADFAADAAPHINAAQAMSEQAPVWSLDARGAEPIKALTVCQAENFQSGWERGMLRFLSPSNFILNHLSYRSSKKSEFFLRRQRKWLMSSSKMEWRSTKSLSERIQNPNFLKAAGTIRLPSRTQLLSRKLPDSQLGENL